MRNFIYVYMYIYKIIKLFKENTEIQIVKHKHDLQLI